MNRSLKTLFIFNGIFVFAGNLFGPLYAIYVSSIDKNILAVTTSWSAFLISTTIFTFLMAQWGDRVKQKERYLIIGYAIRALVWLGYIFSKNLIELIVLQCILGVGEAFGTPAFDAILAEHLDKNKHIKDYSSWKVLSNLVGAVATFFGGLIATTYSFNVLFVFMFLLATISMLGVLKNLKTASPARNY